MANPPNQEKNHGQRSAKNQQRSQEAEERHFAAQATVLRHWRTGACHGHHGGVADAAASQRVISGAGRAGGDGLGAVLQDCCRQARGHAVKLGVEPIRPDLDAGVSVGTLAGEADDLAALRELLERRLGHPEWGVPDLVVADGDGVIADVDDELVHRDAPGDRVPVPVDPHRGAPARDARGIPGSAAHQTATCRCSPA